MICWGCVVFLVEPRTTSLRVYAELVPPSRLPTSKEPKYQGTKGSDGEQPSNDDPGNGTASNKPVQGSGMAPHPRGSGQKVLTTSSC